MTNITKPNTSAQTAIAIAIRNNASDGSQFNLYNVNGRVAFIKSTLSSRKENDTRVWFSVFRMWGDTYPIRAFLREEGWDWDSDEKCWSIEADKSMQVTDFDYVEKIDPLTGNGYNLYISIVIAEPLPEYFTQEKVLYPLFWAMIADQIESRYTGWVGHQFTNPAYGHLAQLRVAHLEMKNFQAAAEYKAAYAWAKSFIDKPAPSIELEDTDI